MPNPLSHFELMSGDPERCKTFYGAVFDWRIDDESMPGYALIHPGAEPNGGIMRKPDGAPAAAMTVYFHVEDIQGTLDKIERHDGTILVPPSDIPRVGTYAIVADPEGIVFGLLQPGS